MNDTPHDLKHGDHLRAIETNAGDMLRAGDGCDSIVVDFLPYSSLWAVVFDEGQEVGRFNLAHCPYIEVELEDPDVAGTCAKCGGEIYHRPGQPGESDHDCGAEAEGPGEVSP